MKEKREGTNIIVVDNTGRIYLPSMLHKFLRLNPYDKIKIWLGNNEFYISPAYEDSSLKSCCYGKKIDRQFRVVVPHRIRTSLGIYKGTEISFRISGDLVIFRIEYHHCKLCGQTGDNLIEHNNNHVCHMCITTLSKKVAV